jgi:ABC-type dipeptide/oligopeptide/nickel transport system ATPase subunit
MVIAEPMRVHGFAKGSEPKDRTAKLLARVGLDPSWIARYPRQLSGGRGQRICIAHALASESRLLVADAIAPALEPRSRGGLSTA